MLLSSLFDIVSVTYGILQFLLGVGETQLALDFSVFSGCIGYDG